MNDEHALDEEELPPWREPAFLLELMRYLHRYSALAEAAMRASLEAQQDLGTALQYAEVAALAGAAAREVVDFHAALADLNLAEHRFLTALEDRFTVDDQGRMTLKVHG